MVMKNKLDDGPVKNTGSINLHLLLENDIHLLTSFSEENLLDIDKSIHEIRKSLKSILSILLLYKVQLVRTQYINWRSHFKAIAKQFASFRESYVYLQTFNRVEEDLKNAEKSSFIELRKHLENNYKLLVKENKKIKDTIRQLRESIITISISVENSHISSDLKLLEKSHRKTVQKTKQLFKTLTLSSSAEDYHKFRKWCRYLYFQEAVLKRLDKKKGVSKEIGKLHKITDYLGYEHDLQLFYLYLRKQFTDMFEIIQPFLLLKIKKLRKKVLALKPGI